MSKHTPYQMQQETRATIGGQGHTVWPIEAQDIGICVVILPDEDKTPETMNERRRTTNQIVDSLNACANGNPEAVPMMAEALRKLCAMLPQELDTVDGRHAFAMHLKKGRAALAKWEEV